MGFRDGRLRRIHKRRGNPRPAPDGRALIDLTRFGSVGEETVVAAPATVLGAAHIRLGNQTKVHPRSFISVVPSESREEKLVIGDRVTLGFDVVIACCQRVEIGDDVLTADRVFIGDSYHEYRDPTRPIAAQGMAEPRSVHIGEGSFIGVGAAIMPGVRLGRNAYVGANAVVTTDVPDFTVVAGVPAKILRRWDGEQWVDPHDGPEDRVPNQA